MCSQGEVAVAYHQDTYWFVNEVPKIKIGNGRLCPLCIRSGVLPQEPDLKTSFYRFYKFGKLDKLRDQPISKPWSAHYGTIEELFSRKSCPICALILQAVSMEKVLLCANSATVGVDGGTQTDVRLSRGWELTRQEVSAREYRLLRQERHDVRVRFNDDFDYKFTLRFSRSRLVPLLWSHFSNNTSEHLFTNPAFFSPQRFNTDLAAQWINDCEEKHSCAVIGNAVADPHLSDFLLIDVTTDCLVSADPKFTKFVTLSYVWGSVPTLKTTLATLPSLKKEGSLYRRRDQLPRVIIDAIIFTKRLSLRYIWIDALCIIDDTEQKHYQIAHMDFIYSRAYLTIIPVSASDASAPIPGIQEGTGYQPRRYTSVNGIKVEYIQHSPDFFDTLRSSTYEQRGWTYQERIMSKRCLFFSSDEVFFLCHAGTQDVTLYRESEPGKLEIAFLISPYLSPLNHAWVNGSKDLDLILRGVQNSIEDYTRRKLSYSLDALNAFSGIMSLASSIFGLTFIYGLPEQDFDEALLWSPGKGCRLKRNPDFPSWSWAGWVGGVSYVYRKGVREGTKISREHKRRKRPTELVAQSRVGIMVQPEILCFNTSTVRASRFSVTFERYTFQIYTKDGLRCGRIMLFGEKTEFSLNIESGDSRFVLLSKSYPWDENDLDQSYSQLPRVCLFVLLVEQKGEYYERIQLCQIHEAAWLAADPELASIKLA